jgi:hypothetical protein
VRGSDFASCTAVHGSLQTRFEVALHWQTQGVYRSFCDVDGGSAETIVSCLAPRCCSIAGAAQTCCRRKSKAEGRRRWREATGGSAAGSAGEKAARDAPCGPTLLFRGCVLVNYSAMRLWAALPTFACHKRQGRRHLCPNAPLCLHTMSTDAVLLLPDKTYLRLACALVRKCCVVQHTLEHAQCAAGSGNWSSAHDRFFDRAANPWRPLSEHNALLVRAMRFGVAPHHSGLSIVFRRAVEALFRAGHLRVIFATGTLAQVRAPLSLEQPCKVRIGS